MPAVFGSFISCCVLCARLTPVFIWSWSLSIHCCGCVGLNLRCASGLHLDFLLKIKAHSAVFSHLSTLEPYRHWAIKMKVWVIKSPRHDSSRCDMALIKLKMVLFINWSFVFVFIAWAHPDVMTLTKKPIKWDSGESPLHLAEMLFKAAHWGQNKNQSARKYSQSELRGQFPSLWRSTSVWQRVRAAQGAHDISTDSQRKMISNGGSGRSTQELLILTRKHIQIDS